MTDASSSTSAPSPTHVNRARSTAQRWLLRTEAVVCFGAPTLALMSAFLYWPLLLGGRAGGHEALLNVGIVVSGVLGLYGLVTLTGAAVHPERRIRLPRWSVLSLCLGAAACGAAVRMWDFRLLTVIILPLVGIGHFLFLARHQWVDLASTSREGTVGPILGRWVAVAMSAALGSIVAGPQTGLQADYTIASTVSRANIEAEYGRLLDQVDKLPEPRLQSNEATEVLKREIAADPTLIYVRLDVTLPTRNNAIWFEKANRALGESECYMRSQAMHRDGLIRCRMMSNGQLVDVLRYSRYGLPSTRPRAVPHNLQIYIDYQRLLTRSDAP